MNKDAVTSVTVTVVVDHRRFVIDGQEYVLLHDAYRMVADARADERERIAQTWQTRDWPIITEAVKAKSIIGAAQVVTDWLRAPCQAAYMGWGCDEQAGHKGPHHTGGVTWTNPV